MGVAIPAGRLELELARRGWTGADLAVAAGISEATVVAARAGRRLAPRTLRAIARALSAKPTLEEVDRLLL